MTAPYSDRQLEPVKLPTPAGPPLAIELRQLRYFVALADAGSFTRAAERIFIAQPALSQQIRRLEEIIGTPLLRRRRDGLRLTRYRGEGPLARPSRAGRVGAEGYVLVGHASWAGGIGPAFTGPKPGGLISCGCR
jgi:hypothetical protein